MSYTREEYQEFLTTKAAERVNGNRGNLEFLAQAEVKQKNLTGNPDFDTFLSYIQEAAERMRGEFLVMKDKLCDSAISDPAEIMASKLLISEMKGRIQAMEAVLSLPNEITEKGEKARESLGG